MEVPRDPQAAIDGAMRMTRQLEEIQRRTNVYFAMPESFSAEELDDIDLAHALPSGQTATGTWRRFCVTVPADYLRSEEASVYRESTIPDFFVQSPFTLGLAGQEHPLGIARKTFASARVVDRPTPNDGEAADTPIALTFEPGDDDTVTISLVDLASTLDDAGGSAEDSGDLPAACAGQAR